MKIHCSKTVLVNALSALSRIIPACATHPILSGFMIFTRNDTLVLQANRSGTEPDYNRSGRGGK